MKNDIMPSQQYLCECFEYLEDGSLIGKFRPRHHFETDAGHKSSLRQVTGKPVGTLTSHGYLQVALTYLGKSVLLYVHRIVWTIHKGEIPSNCVIDHKDTNRIVNRIDNLRLTEQLHNSHNANLSTSNTSGVKGVYWDKTNKRWKAQICNYPKRVSVGSFSSIEAATLAIQNARIQLHGEFTNHG